MSLFLIHISVQYCSHFELLIVINIIILIIIIIIITYYKQLSWDDLGAIGGKPARETLSHYSHSVLDTLQTLYPEIPFFPWLFDKVPAYFWDEKSNQRQYCDWFRQETNLSHPNQWYQVSVPIYIVWKQNGICIRYFIFFLSLHR